jgi:hypothetical protein
MTAGQSAEGLWQNYLFLTKEMDRFLAAGDTDMFLDLLDEREKLQAILDRADTREFKKSPVGRKTFADLTSLNAAIMKRLTLLRNQSQKRDQLAGAYDLMNRPVGNWMDRKG